MNRIVRVSATNCEYFENMFAREILVNVKKKKKKKK